IDHMGEEAGLEGAALQTVQDAARARLKVMIRYCQSPDCLRIQLLKYFGQDAKPCDFCSNCLTPPQVEDVTEAAGIVLRCVAHTGSRFGQGMIVDILKGSKSEKIRKLRLDQIPEYGCLQPFPREKITRLLDRLLEDDVLMTEQILTRSGQLPVLKPGTGWDAFLKGEISVHISVRHEHISGGRKRSGKRETLVVADPALYQKLVLLRKQIAAQRHVPPYVVFTDHVLRQLSERKPRTLEQLLDINGIGLVKQKQFGEIFLEAINSYPTERI
ncbi:MAG: RQC domain-containing protein, partial [Christensenellales bacterium]|nr:RQC domain-containing protein [Christensenellales bacterium]